MKMLLMGLHIDGLQMPVGVERHSCAHEWKVNEEKTKMDPLGRPYCIKCGGMPMWYDLEEVDAEEDFEYAMRQVTSGSAIVID